MFELIDYKPEHLMAVIAEGTVQPELKFGDEITEWAEALAEFPAATGIYDCKIVSCGGIIILAKEHRAEAWAIFVKDIGSYHIDPRMARAQLYDWMIDYGIVRLEAPLRADFPAGLSYARYLGFAFEGVHKKYHPDGVDAHMHVIIREEG